MAIAKCLTVIKLGGSDVFDSNFFYKDLARLVAQGEKIVLVVGGKYAIKQMFAAEKHKTRMLELANGDKVKFCGEKEITLIEKAYTTIVFPEIFKKLTALKITHACFCGKDNRLVMGEKYPALKVKFGKKFRIERGSLVGHITSVDLRLIMKLINMVDVLIVAPPIAARSGFNINVDADMLAAVIATQIRANFLHFLTKTHGILENIKNAKSTIVDIYAEEHLPAGLKGRIKQKVRAALYALNNCEGVLYTTISTSTQECPITQMDHSLTTHVWKIKQHSSDCNELLTKMLQIPSVSQCENRLASYIKYRLQQKGINTHIDEVGNVVSKIGTGPKKILLLGHIDTVPGNIPLKMEREKIFARGAVDAKGVYAAFIEACKNFINSTDIEILLIGGVEEEIHTAKGGEFVRENYSADGVIIGEPSNLKNITLGYRGIFRIKITTSVLITHSAAKNYISASDQIVEVYHGLTKSLKKINIENVSLRQISSWYEKGKEKATAIINIRFSDRVKSSDIEKVVHCFQISHSSVSFEIICSAPAVLFSRTSLLAKSFYRAIKLSGRQPAFVSKSGTSFMNRLKKTWSCDMLAFGPGDSKLDHTDQEFIEFEDVITASKIIKTALNIWSKSKT